MLQEEQIYLDYVEDHLREQERMVKRDVLGQAISPRASPIRKMNEFFASKINKFGGQDPLLSQKIGKSVKPQNTHSSTYVNTDLMTAKDVSKLEKSPPKVRTQRKHIKLANNEVFDKFGAAAFGLRDSSLNTSLDGRGKSKNKDEASKYSSNISRSKYDSTQKKRVKDSHTPKKHTN